MSIYTAIASAVEEYGSQSEDYDADGGSAGARVTLRVPAADRHAVAEDVLLNGYAWPHGGGVNPAIASKVSIVPAPDSGGTVAGGGYTYTDYLLTIIYSTKKLTSGKQEDSFGNVYSEELEPHTEFMTQDHKDFMWSSDQAPLKEGESPGRILKSFNLRRTLYNLFPPLPIDLLDLPGCCNDSPFTSPTLGLTFPAETLLFGDPVISRMFTTAGTFTGMTLSMLWSYKKDGWNRYWRAKTQDYDEIKLLDGTVYKNNPPADMSSLLF